nr:hypothetical protein [Actinomadura sp. WMMB 499]
MIFWTVSDGGPSPKGAAPAAANSSVAAHANTSAADSARRPLSCSGAR